MKVKERDNIFNLIDLTGEQEEISRSKISGTFRMQLLPVSEIKRLPRLSSATLVGEFNSALLAGPPSPALPARSAPTRVLILFGAIVKSIIRILLKPESATNSVFLNFVAYVSSPHASPFGLDKLALSASSLSPAKSLEPYNPAIGVKIPALDTEYIICLFVTEK